MGWQSRQFHKNVGSPINTIEDARQLVQDLIKKKSPIGTFVLADTEIAGRRIIRLIPDPERKDAHQYKRIAKLLELNHPVLIIVVSEVWLSTNSKNIEPKLDPERKEAVRIWLMTSFSIRSGIFSFESNGLNTDPEEERDLQVTELDADLRALYDSLNSWGTVH